MDCQQLPAAKLEERVSAHAVKLELNRDKSLIKSNEANKAVHKITEAEMINAINSHWSYDKATQK